MGKIQKFEDLIAWQKARSLTRKIYQITQSGAFSKDFNLVSQIRRAAVSAMSNIAEGFERFGEKEFPQYLSMAKSSCAEIRSQLYIALDVGYLDGKVFRELLESAEEVARIVGALRTAVQVHRNSTQHSALSTQHSKNA
ncbi:MAG: four helix bundle protein [Elusimicrobia bacterium]|nr:four helix bundle protein [Elusimicrobiota bacterium]